MSDQNVSYAGFWVRFVASFVDGIIISIFLIPVAFLLGAGIALGGGTESIASIAGGILGLVAGIAYYAGFHASSKQATLGKMLLKIRVVGKDGERISFMRATGRYLATYLSGIFYIGYILAGVHPKKRSLHDLMVNTYVIHND